jgi:hypothetical protein
LLDPAVATAKATAAFAELDLRWKKSFYLGTIKIKYNSYKNEPESLVYVKLVIPVTVENRRR